MLIAISTHIAGMLVAIIFAWYLPLFFVGTDDAMPMQYTLLLTMSMWGIWHLVRIVRRQDKKSNLIIAYFDK